MKTIAILGTANVAGAVRYAIEGPIPVRDDAEAKRLVDLGLAEYVGDEDADDGLDDEKVADLKKIAEDDKIDLGGATTKADIIAAIRAHRDAAGE